MGFTKVDKNGINRIDLEGLHEMYPDALRMIVISKRTSGKNHSMCSMIVNRFLETGERSVYLRRRKEDINSVKIEDMFCVNHSGDDYNFDFEWQESYYLMAHAEGHRITIFVMDGENCIFEFMPCYYGCVEKWESEKGENPENCTMAVYDEFLSMNRYLRREVTCLENACSSWTRNKKYLLVMLGNPLDEYSYSSYIGCPPCKLVENQPFVWENSVSLLCDVGTYESDVCYTDKSITSGVFLDERYPRLGANFEQVWCIQVDFDVQFYVSLYTDLKNYYLFVHVSNSEPVDEIITINEFSDERNNILVSDYKLINEKIQESVKFHRFVFENDSCYNLLNRLI